MKPNKPLQPTGPRNRTDNGNRRVAARAAERQRSAAGGCAKRTTMSSKPYRGVAMEGGVARWYTARAKRKRDDYQALARRIAESLQSEAKVLEVAPGPGHLHRAREAGDYRIAGLDIERNVRRNRVPQRGARGVDVDFRLGDVADMPFADAAFDCVVCRAAFKNFSQPEKALREMRRVLKGGGAAVLIELRRDVSSRAINQHVRKVTTSQGVVRETSCSSLCCP